jgi:hypothetical protein
LAVQFGPENLERLAERLEIHTIPERAIPVSVWRVAPATRDNSAISHHLVESLTVSGDAGSLRFAYAGGEKFTTLDERLAFQAFVEEAPSWLGIESLEATGGRVVDPGSEHLAEGRAFNLGGDTPG